MRLQTLHVGCPTAKKNLSYFCTAKFKKKKDLYVKKTHWNKDRAKAEKG